MVLEIEKIPEFKYNYGDPRPTLFYFLMNMPNFGTVPAIKKTYKDVQKIEPFDDKDCITISCSENKKRTLKLPTTYKFYDIFRDQEKTIDQYNIIEEQDSLIVIPVNINHVECAKNKDHSKHTLFLIYNKLVQTIQFIDIKAYHLNRFRVVAREQFIKKCQSKLESINKNIKIVQYFDIPLRFLTHLNLDIYQGRNYYPMFVLVYLYTLSQYPTLESHECINMIFKSTKTKLQKITEDLWNDYTSYRQKMIDDTCKNPLKIRNPETRRCVGKMSRTMKKLLVNKEKIACARGLYYDEIRKQCVKKDIPKDVSLVYSRVNKDLTWYDKSLPEDVDVQNLMAKFILSKYTYAHLVNVEIDWRRSKDIDDLEFEDKTDPYVLTFERNFWKSFYAGMKNPSIKFVIAQLRLGCHYSPYCHANNLIYNKETNDIERFDPHGISLTFFEPENLDKQLKEIFMKKINKELKYSAPLDICPAKRIFQSFESAYYITNSNYDGNCFIWNLWYIEIKLRNPQVETKDLIALAMKKLQNVSSMHTWINSYHNFNLRELLKNKTYAKKVRNLLEKEKKNNQ